VGWFKDASCKTPWNFTTDKVTCNITLYADWILNSYTIKTTAGTGGTVSGGGTFKDGMTVTLTAAPKKDYTFVGWYENGIKLSGTNAVYSFNASTNRTLDAHFEKTNQNSNSQGGNSQGGNSQKLSQNSDSQGDNKQDSIYSGNNIVLVICCLILVVVAFGGYRYYKTSCC
jgi:uncharacterized repeat protein (TIGR02543 family)